MTYPGISGFLVVATLGRMVLAAFAPAISAADIEQVLQGIGSTGLVDATTAETKVAPSDAVAFDERSYPFFSLKRNRWNVSRLASALRTYP